LRTDPAAAAGRFTVAYDELRRTAPLAPELAQILGVLPEAIRQVELIRVNSETDVPRYGPRLNFLIGGNILGRGLTIDDLLVTYYVREAQVSQMDTVWQHARMYGYRMPLMPYTRVYLPSRVAARFKGIHEAEEELRALLRRAAAGENVPVRVAIGTRPTRPNATEPGALQVIGAGLDQIFPWYVQDDPPTATRIRQLLDDSEVPVGVDNRDARTTRIPLDQVLELVGLVPLRDDDLGRWSPGAITLLIEQFRDQYQGQGSVYVRGLDAAPDPQGWRRGRLSGPEIALIGNVHPDDVADTVRLKGQPHMSYQPGSGHRYTARGTNRRSGALARRMPQGVTRLGLPLRS
jgi:plasmid stability protein